MIFRDVFRGRGRSSGAEGIRIKSMMDSGRPLSIFRERKKCGWKTSKASAKAGLKP